MSDQVVISGLTKAQLIELKQDLSDEKGGGHKVVVQFNPETLKVSFANQIDTPKGGDQASGTAGRQFVGSGTTKLSLQLWFDASASEGQPVDDVRRLTQDVIFFMTPQKSDSDPKRLSPPGVRFLWGSFIFDGLVDSLEESLEFFSPAGKPLRASVSLAMSQQKILHVDLGANTAGPPTKGTKPLTPARQGDTLADMAAKAGKGDWQAIAQANGIEDPLRMKPGQLVDMAASALPRF